MTDQELRDIIRQMLKDWDNATEEQRQYSLRVVSERAAKVQDKINRGEIEWK